MELSILITMVVTLIGCLSAALLLAGVATAILLVTGHGLRKSFNNGFLLGLVPLFIPAWMIACNVGFFLPTFQVFRDGVSTTGTVVDYSEHSGDGGITYSSIVEYQNADGVTVRFDDTLVSSDPPRHALGQKVDVVYLPNDPDHAVIRDALWWVVPAILFAVTMLLVPFGYLFAWHNYRKGTWSTLDFLFDLF